MKVIIDRFEEDFAVCELENKDIKNIQKERLPEGAKRGMVLNIDSDTITIDWNETLKVRKETEELMKELWE